MVVVGGGCAVVVFELTEADVGWHGSVSSLGWLVFWWVYGCIAVFAMGVVLFVFVFVGGCFGC